MLFKKKKLLEWLISQFRMTNVRYTYYCYDLLLFWYNRESMNSHHHNLKTHGNFISEYSIVFSRELVWFFLQMFWSVYWDFCIENHLVKSLGNFTLKMDRMRTKIERQNQHSSIQATFWTQFIYIIWQLRIVGQHI